MFDWRAIAIAVGVILLLVDLGSNNYVTDEVKRSFAPPHFLSINMMTYDLILLKVAEMKWPLLSALIGSLSLVGVLLSIRVSFFISLFKWKKNLNSSNSNASATSNDYYPDYLVFCSNYTTMENLAALRDETTKAEMKRLFRSDDWRMHLRGRGKDETKYNWQLREQSPEGQQSNCVVHSDDSDIEVD